MVKARRKQFCYDYPRPAVTVDTIVFTVAEGVLKVPLIPRAHAPFAGRWAIPGGFVDLDESLDAAALRELIEETGVRNGRASTASHQIEAASPASRAAGSASRW